MELYDILLPALGETLYMVFVATFLAVIIGFLPAIIMVITDENGLNPNKTIYKVLDVIVNILRSFPFIILMIVIFLLLNL
jgi:D-methionine transport system permease protein